MTASPGSPDPQLPAVEDPRLSLEAFVEMSRGSLAPLLSHLVQGDLLGSWCGYVIDSAVQQFYGWKHPEGQHLYWWLDTDSEATVRSWLEQGSRGIAMTWHMAVATAYFSAANAWFAPDLEDRYVARRHVHERAHCRLIDCGPNQGLALDLSLALEADPDQLEAILAPLGDQLRLSTEVISLADIRSGIPQVLAGSPPGEWLPPFHNGASWILLQVERHERPTLQELAPRLLLEAIRAWRQQRCQQLTAHWLQVYSASQATSQAAVDA
jgi:hypothetical protein